MKHMMITWWQAERRRVEILMIIADAVGVDADAIFVVTNDAHTHTHTQIHSVIIRSKYGLRGVSCATAYGLEQQQPTFYVA